MDFSGPRREARAPGRARLQGRPCHRRDSVARHLAALSQPDGDGVMLSRESSATLISAVTAFLYKEARLQDEHQYEAWEALWTDDGVYWVPANGDDIDPEKEMSIIYDNRSRISLRIKQLLTGKRHTQTPQSRLRRTPPTIHRQDQQPGGDISAASNSMVFESSLRDDTIWAARNEYRLRYVGAELRMAYKKVVLVNNEKALFTLSFLI